LTSCTIHIQWFYVVNDDEGLKMPRGIAKSGVRMTAKRLSAAMQHQEVVAQQPKVVIQTETDAEIEARLNDNYEAMHTMALATALGKNKTLIISGPAGVGKSSYCKTLQV
jgi:DNA replication protein DnaC